MNWRVANSLLVLRAQINAAYPRRDKTSDGTIGNEEHRNRSSDHNPHVIDARGQPVVTALDIDHDPKSGCDAHKIAETLRMNRDRRIETIISRSRIMSPRISWEWRPYVGRKNPHNEHFHISVRETQSLYDDQTPWRLALPGSVVTPTQVPIGRKRQQRIWATVWDDEQGAYPPYTINHTLPCVSLPFRFKVPRPKVRLITPQGTVVCPITDIGPHYDGTATRPADPYWDTGTRPRAETEKQNKAGIDINPVAAEMIGIRVIRNTTGKIIAGGGWVDWEFA